MTNIFHHTKLDGRSLWLYSQQPRSYEITEDMAPLGGGSQPVRRWHPLREEFVFYNASRNTRTLNPSSANNPLAPVKKGDNPGEIPVADFEIAVFDNRWPALTQADVVVDAALGGEPATGKCEVVVYSTQEDGSLGDFSVEHIAMLLDVWGIRHRELSANDNISYVMPFENRGAGVGVTLPHPHGQIYAFSQTPRIVEHQCEVNKHTGYLDELVSAPDEWLIVDQNEAAVTLCPAFSRYPYETWMLPKSRVATPSDMADETRLAFAAQLKDHINRYDRLFGEPMDYVMWVSFPPKGYEDSWPFHLQFWPLKRGKGKMKFLASVEQITQLFISDVLPEDAAATLRTL